MDRFTSGKETTKFEQTVPTEIKETLYNVTSTFDEFKRKYDYDKEEHNDQHCRERYETDLKIKEVKDISDQYFAEMNIRTLSVLLPLAMLLDVVLRSPVIRFINLFTKWYQYNKNTKSILLKQAPRIRSIVGREFEEYFNLTEWIDANKDIDN